MKQVTRRILTFCTACLLAVGVLASPLRGYAATWDGGGEPSTPTLGSSSLKDLLQRLENREPEITLTDHVEVDGNITIATAYNAPVTVHMGDYGIRVLEGANLHLSGPITFIGEGDTVPLFQLERDASMIDYMGGVTIAATGDNAAALSMEPGVYLFCPGLDIRATGSGSTAVEIQEDVRLDRLRITADRQDSVAISADGDLYLRSCAVSGEIHVAGDLALDLSSVSPMPEHARIIRRQALWVHDGIDMNLFGYSAVAGNIDPLPDTISMELVDVEAVEETYWQHDVPIRWETGGQDLSRPGTYTVHGAPEINNLPGLEGACRTVIQVQIMESGRPYLIGIQVPNALYIRLHFLEEIEDLEELRLYHSPDGENWTQLDEEMAELYPWGGDITGLKWEQDHYLQLEVVGGPFAGRSNILLFWLDENGVPGDGGTRDGTGQEGGEDPGPNPGDGDNGGSGNNGAGRTGSGGGSGSSKQDADATIPVFGAAEPITEEPPPEQLEAGTPAVTLTAPQLATLLEVNPEQLAFHENGMTVVIPSELLTALALEEESLSVSMGMDGADGFHISIFSGDGEIISFDGQAFQLWVPCEVNSEALEYLYILDHTGAEQFADDYEDGRLLFHLTHTGSYTILNKQDDGETALETVAANQQPPSLEEPLPEEPAEDGGRFPILPVAATLTVILVAGGAVLLYKRGGKRLGGKTE